VQYFFELLIVAKACQEEVASREQQYSNGLCTEDQNLTWSWQCYYRSQLPQDKLLDAWVEYCWLIVHTSK